MQSDLASALLASFAIFFIGAVVYFHDRKSASNRFFLALSLATVFWAMANYFSLHVPEDRVIVWVRLVLFFAAPHAVFFLLFTEQFPSRERPPLRVWLPLTVLLVVVMGAVLSPYVFSDVAIIEGRPIPTPGILMPLFALVVFVSLGAGLVLMIRKYRVARDEERVQWRFMLVGVAASYILLIITNFWLVVAFQNTYFVIFGPLFMLPAIVGMGYAILRHHLLNVKAIASEILTFIILSVSLFEVFTSASIRELSLRLSTFVLFLIFGVFLIRSVLREVEEREKVQELAGELEAANQELRTLDQAKSEFISLASHQLRTPLTAIKGYVSMVLEGSFGDIGARVKEALDRVFVSSNQLVNLVNDLLDLSRIESGKMQYQFTDVHMEDIITRVMKELEETARKKEIAFEFHNSVPAGATVRGDVEKLHEAVINLVDNAVKYSSAGTIALTLERTEQSGVASLRFSVTDRGIGIRHEDMGKLFVKFARSDEAKKVRPDGMGIGLYFVKKIIEDHKGKVWVTSPGPGQGSTFFLELPIA